MVLRHKAQLELGVIGTSSALTRTSMVSKSPTFSVLSILSVMSALIAELAKISSVLVIMNWIPPFTYPLDNSPFTLFRVATCPTQLDTIGNNM